MTNLPPFMNSTGLIPKIFGRAAEAQQPQRFTQDFLSTKLGYGSGSARPFIPLLKRLGLLQADGTPTTLYARMRNPGERGSAMAEAIRHGYADVFERNDWAHELPREKFRDLIVEMTGQPRDSSTVAAIVGTFFALKSLADFEAQSPSVVTGERRRAPQPLDQADEDREAPRSPHHRGLNGEGDNDLSMNLSYTINLNLPESTNPEVFNAIFKALREHLLRK